MVVFILSSLTFRTWDKSIEFGLAFSGYPAGLLFSLLFFYGVV